MRITALAFCALAALGLAACGARAVRLAHAHIQLHQSDDGRTIGVRSGDTIELVLVESRPVPGSGTVWTASSTDQRVLSLTSAHRDPAKITPVGSDSYIADFHAAAAGRAGIQAMGATSCEAMVKSACPDRSFSVTIDVSA